jgi:hypothetical protein
MQELPHLAILNRQEALGHAQEHFAPQLALLRDLANYGSNLIVRAFASSPKKLEDVVICGVLLKQVVAMIDAVEVLLSAGVAQAAFLPARAAFEAGLYMDWMLVGDSEHKAKCYFVSNYRDERKWASIAINGTPEAHNFAQVMAQHNIDLHANRPTLLGEATSHLAEVNRILAQAEFAPIDAEFDQRKNNGKRKREVEWYVLTGMNSIRQIASAVDRLAEYEMFYGKGSRITHTASYKGHIRFTADQIHFKPVRHVAELSELLRFLTITSIGAYRKVLTRYRPGELPAFSQKYKDDWQDPFFNIRNVTYTR